ncbi:hypothetical protein BWD09_06990 [Neisseria dentiae]|uniref:Uncharacterized protein n=1 Tax=Neisseria dentiae TaxID=194197 RepID=A0A1X3D9W9_9NEIS|nr:hypothetical protein [Neisseria dentiae]OSI16504.1 hypothetical protein BWD09_06990 [Neisseria dentiae]QMT44230.1 hypothetical protein H3L92_06955 [Neisseria dentiae]STZ49904.1 Uncharacterised protein [Neisseria dentiae]STZ83160.1 Uncharacterised protein [Neisseria dentiae]
MCNPAIFIAAAGAIQAEQGRQKQAFEFERAQRADDFYENARQQLLLQQRQQNEDFAKQKNDAIVKEAEEVSPLRLEKIIQAEDAQTRSNVKALQDLNAVGNESISQYADGNHSETYLKARANTAAKQTEQAIALARLFASQSAPSDAIATQKQNSLMPRLEQGLIDSRRNSANRGFNVLFDNMASLRNRATRVDPTKGQAQQALGGAMMQYGMGQMGESAGGYFGNQSANQSIKNNLF